MTFDSHNHLSVYEWFWLLLKNLGLDSMTNDCFDGFICDDILSKFTLRKYDSKGRGGLLSGHRRIVRPRAAQALVPPGKTNAPGRQRRHRANEAERTKAPIGGTTRVGRTVRWFLSAELK